jgi:hypothetical protein
VLANLGWVADGAGTARKLFHEQGFSAHFETGSFFSYGDDDDAGGVTGGLSFWPITMLENAGGRAERRIPLGEIPPLVFSEVLRDLDLVTVVAHQSDEEGSSREVIQRRADLVRAIVDAAGLAAVRVEEPSVFVRGSLASYRVSLTTGAIYLESGQYLCIVPERKQQQAIYLPFAEGGEPLSSEIVSKVLLLSADSQIRDATILSQISAFKRAA